MRLGLIYVNRGVNADPGFAAELALAAEEAGFDSVWASDHVALPGSARPPVPPDPRAPPGDAYVDPWVFLSFLAGVTRRLLLATGVLVLPLRHPLLTAKAVASLDHLSGGRAVLGVGIGWAREEFRALGVPFEGRAQALEQGIAVLRSSWSGSARPRPVRGRVPIVIGGQGPAAARRALAMGDGFFPSGPRAAELIALVRARSDLEITLKAPPTAAEMAGVGPVDRLLVPVARGRTNELCAGRPEDLARLAEIIRGARGARGAAGGVTVRGRRVRTL